VRNNSLALLFLAQNIRMALNYGTPVIIASLYGLKASGLFFVMQATAALIAPLISAGKSFETMRSSKYVAAAVPLAGIGLGLFFWSTSTLFSLTGPLDARETYFLSFQLASVKAVSMCLEAWFLVKDQRLIMVIWAATLSLVVPGSIVVSSISGFDSVTMLKHLIYAEGVLCVTVLFLSSRVLFGAKDNDARQPGGSAVALYGWILALSGAMNSFVASGERIMLPLFLSLDEIAVYGFIYMLCFAPVRIVFPPVITHLQNIAFAANTWSDSLRSYIFILLATLLWGVAVGFGVDNSCHWFPQNCVATPVANGGQIAGILGISSGFYAWYQSVLSYQKVKFKSLQFIHIYLRVSVIMLLLVFLLGRIYGVLGVAIACGLTYAFGVFFSYRERYKSIAEK
jgi:hypothetical protein